MSTFRVNGEGLSLPQLEAIMPRRSLSVFYAVLALTILSPASGHAQQAVKPMSIVRVSRAEDTLTARLADLDSISITVASSKGLLLTIPRREVLSIERRGSYAKRGAKIGAFVGGGLGALFLGWMAHGLCDSVDGCTDGTIGATLVGGLLGTPLGAALGAGAGATIPRWATLSADARIDRPLN